MKTRNARKDHTCTLCHLVIPAGTKYRYETLTPWGHEVNETFGMFKAHWECEEKWQEIGDNYDWILPESKWDWMEMIDG